MRIAQHGRKIKREISTRVAEDFIHKSSSNATQKANKFSICCDLYGNASYVCISFILSLIHPVLFIVSSFDDLISVNQYQTWIWLGRNGSNSMIFMHEDTEMYGWIPIKMATDWLVCILWLELFILIDP